ncbi:uncharacterized protein LOC134822579 [Bolinopsis microptera]|uniref:uncharacterized protein LOC134822579 n=1 Tax=Bolinopsis microptera TaxID=2820187 RepID=UPI003079F8ED
MGWRDVEMPDGTVKKFIWSPKYDPRYPSFNQGPKCNQYFIDFQKCIWKKGEGYKPCDWFRHHYEHICPQPWIEKWNDQLDRGVFPSKQLLKWQNKYPKAAAAEEEE